MKSTENNSERRRLPRLNVSSEQFKLMPEGKVFSVGDLSVDGLSIHLLEREDFKHFPIAARVTGVLNLRGHKLPVTLIVRNSRDRHVGLSFDASLAGFAEVKAQLEKLLSPEILGAELKPMPGAMPGVLWYHGPSGTDLLIWRGWDGEYQKFSLFVQGSAITWEREQGVSTGRLEATAEREELRGLVRLDSVVVHADATPLSDTLTIAKRIILSSNLPEELKRWMERQLRA